MTAHSSAIDIGSDQPALPNQHFSSWLRGQTTLFISQIVAILTFVLFIAEEVYYVSHFGEHQGLLEPLKIKLIIDVAHIVFMAIFIMVLIKFLDDNERGSHRVELVEKRVFHGRRQGEGTYKDALEGSKKQLKKFKKRFLWFWIGMLVLYVCFACQHGYNLTYSKKAPSSHETHSVTTEASKTAEDKQESHKTDSNSHASQPVEASSLPNKTTETKETNDSSLEQSDGEKVWVQLRFSFLVFALNNFTLFFIYLCFLILYIPAEKMESAYRRQRNWAFVMIVALTAAFPVLAVVAFIFKEFTSAEWNAFVAIFDALSGVTNAIVLALLVARLDSKLVGLPSWLISILYSYAAAQPLFMVFELNQTEIFDKITTAVLIFVFVSKIYFFLIITYAMQTGKLLNYLSCFPILQKRTEEARAKFAQPTENSNTTQTLPDQTKPTEPLVVHVEIPSSTRFGIHLWIPRTLDFLANLMTKDGGLLFVKVFGGLAIGTFFALLIISVLDQRGPAKFSAADLKNPDGLAAKIRPDKDPLSKYLYEKLSPETRKQLDEHHKQLSEFHEAHLSTEIEKALLLEEVTRILGEPEILNRETLDRDKLKHEIQELITQQLQTNAHHQEPMDEQGEMLQKVVLDEVNKVLREPELLKPDKPEIDTQKLITLEPHGYALINEKDLDQHTAVSAPSAQLKHALFTELNKVLRDPELFNEERFHVKELKEDTKKLIAQRPQGNSRIHLNRLLLEEAYPRELAQTERSKVQRLAYFNRTVDIINLLFVSIAICLVYYVRKQNRHSEGQTIATAKHVFGNHLDIKHTTEHGNQQLTKFKQYFCYFWCATFFLYLVFLLKHFGFGFGLHDSSPIENMVRIMLYPFLEFSLGSMNLLFIFWCFVVLRSPAYPRSTEFEDDELLIQQRVLINYSSFVVALLVAAYPLFLFVIGGPNLVESNLRDYATLFDGLAGMLSAVVVALLIARMDSKWFGFSPWHIGLLFAYASIQPLFVVFALNDSILQVVQTSVLITALLLKVCLFLMTMYALQSGRALTYLYCFPLLKERVDSIFENQFEIRLARVEEEFTLLILKKNKPHYSTTKKFKDRKECDEFVSELQDLMEHRKTYGDPCEEAGTYWVEVKKGPHKPLLCESIPLRSEKEALKLIDESIKKIPYCKYNRV